MGELGYIYSMTGRETDLKERDKTMEDLNKVVCCGKYNLVRIGAKEHDEIISTGAGYYHARRIRSYNQAGHRWPERPFARTRANRWSDPYELPVLHLCSWCKEVVYGCTHCNHIIGTVQKSYFLYDIYGIACKNCGATLVTGTKKQIDQIVSEAFNNFSERYTISHGVCEKCAKEIEKR